LKNNHINSIGKIFEKNKRKIITDNSPLTLHKTINFKAFMFSDNPYLIFRDFNKIKVEDRNFFNSCKNLNYKITDLEEILKDLKLLNKSTITKILKYRTKDNLIRNNDNYPVKKMEIEEELNIE